MNIPDKQAELYQTMLYPSYEATGIKLYKENMVFKSHELGTQILRNFQHIQAVFSSFCDFN